MCKVAHSNPTLLCILCSIKMRKVVELGMRDAHIYQHRKLIRKGKTQPDIDKYKTYLFLYLNNLALKE